MCTSLYIGFYIYIYKPYTPKISLEYIYMGAIYMFGALILLLLCILSFAYMCLGMLQAVVLHQIWYNSLCLIWKGTHLPGGASWHIEAVIIS